MVHIGKIFFFMYLNSLKEKGHRTLGLYLTFSWDQLRSEVDNYMFIKLIPFSYIRVYYMSRPFTLRLFVIRHQFRLIMYHDLNITNNVSQTRCMS